MTLKSVTSPETNVSVLEISIDGETFAAAVTAVIPASLRSVYHKVIPYNAGMIRGIVKLHAVFHGTAPQYFLMVIHP